MLKEETNVWNFKLFGYLIIPEIPGAITDMPKMSSILPSFRSLFLMMIFGAKRGEGKMRVGNFTGDTLARGVITSSD
ncbi:hypothetical protein CEXT_238031 [Caerostris extrusa]|uniref:Uncharacterized protein n=1 Tax=Caerostris extrusa TaxID=172846 RepID=A0AAV4UGI8_CAEEX|nr:hypothetical protein CEXT_238031 [Caerostris extrusa]